ncbi:MAG: hypothetical protein LBC99_06405 [Spirochaetota bacterium]|jgi:signal transduction histidine kinase|nr:hypothetical protein [Spirochaetota bacterium]
MQDKSEQYRLKLFSDLLVQAGGIENAEPLLLCIADHLGRVMDIDHAWLVAPEGNHYATYTFPAQESCRMGKETIAFLMADEFHTYIPQLSLHRTARGVDFFPPDAESLVSLPSHNACLVIASRRRNAYSKTDIDFLYTLMLALRPHIRRVYTRDQPDAAARRALTDMLVHDIRAPLGIINWNMEQLLDGVTGAISAEQERFIRSSIESTQELLEMADSLLDIDRLESGGLLLDPEDCSLEQLARNIAGRMDFVTQQMGLRFHFDFPEDYPCVRADRQLMRRVLFNLLFNAAKYAPAGSVIYIEGGVSADTLHLAIRDEGQGVPEEYLESIFDKYVQAEARAGGGIPGKGLGLTFCRLAVLAHGGAIRAENVPHGGARFVIEFKRERG